MNRRLIVAAITVAGVLVAGIGTATAASSNVPSWKKCPPYAITAVGVGQGASENALERRHIPRRCWPKIPTSTSTRPTLPPTTPSTVFNCITEPCCPPNAFCRPPVTIMPPPVTIEPKPPVTITPRPPITIEPWLQDPPIYCPMLTPSVDTEKVPQKSGCGCPPKTRIATDGGGTYTPQVMCPTVATKPAVTKL
jgi:hypothetical protein